MAKKPEFMGMPEGGGKVPGKIPAPKPSSIKPKHAKKGKKKG